MTALPNFSIIIPTYRRPERLGACLEALTALDYPRDHFEVIVVDDGSGPAGPGLATSAGETLDVTLVRQPHAGPATARNTGSAQARGDYLAFTDDDCTPDAGWLRALAAQIIRAPDHAIGGRIVNALPDNPFATASQSLTDFLYSWHAERRSGRFFVSCNLAVSAELFRRRGGFHPAFTLPAGEDREFCHRWVTAGGGMTYAHEAVVYHANQLTLKSFWRQHFGYGRGAFLVHRLRSLDQPRVAAPLAFYLRLVAFPLFRTPRGRRLTLTALLALAQAATVCGYSRERFRRLQPWTELAIDRRGPEYMTRSHEPSRITRNQPHRR